MSPCLSCQIACTLMIYRSSWTEVSSFSCSWNWRRAHHIHQFCAEAHRERLSGHVHRPAFHFSKICGTCVQWERACVLYAERMHGLVHRPAFLDFARIVEKYGVCGGS